MKPEQVPALIAGMEDDVYAAPESGFESHRPLGADEAFSFMRCMSEGGEAFRRNPAPGILATIVVSVLLFFAYLVFLTSFGAVAGAEDVGVLMAFFLLVLGGSLALYVFYRLLQAGMQKLGMNLVRGEARVEDLFGGFHRVGAVSGATLLMAFVQMIVPFVLFVMMSVLAASSEAISEQIDQLESEEAGFWVLGGIMALITGVKVYLDGRLLLVFPLLLERKAGVVAAIVESWRLTAPQQLQLALLTLMTEIGVMIGFLCCGIGALVTVPLHYTIHGSAATQLLGKGPASNSSDSDGDFDRDPGPDPAPAPAPEPDRFDQANPFDSSPYS